MIPNYEQSFPLKESRQPANLSLLNSSKVVQSPEPSPKQDRFRKGSHGSVLGSVIEGPFMYVGPQRKRFHAVRLEAPYLMPCGMEELSRFSPFFELEI